MPYLFVMLLWVAPITGYFYDWDLGYLIKKYIFCIDPSQLWFLWMLFWVFTIVWLIKNIILKKPVLGWFIVLMFYGVGKVGAKLIPNIFCIWTAFRYILFFYIGMRIRYKEENKEGSIVYSLPWFVWIIIYLGIFFGLEFIAKNNGVVWKLIIACMNFSLHVVGAIMAWTSLQILGKVIQWRNNMIFEAFSSYSMPMYLFHQQIIYFSITALNGKIDPWINACANYIFAILGSFVISKIFMHWKVTRALIGEK